MKRDSAIELYRCMMMFGIVFLHCAALVENPLCWGVAAVEWCVDGFAFVSGYCGIRRFSLMKVFALLLTAAICIVVSNLAENILQGSWRLSLGWGELLLRMQSLWFIHAYILMMVLAPMVNLVVETENGAKFLLPFCSVVVMWGFLSELPVLRKYMFTTNGIGSFGALTLTAVYAIARMYREYGLDVRIKLGWAFGAIPILLILVIMGWHNKDGVMIYGVLGKYASPFSVLMALCVFHVIRRITLPECLGRFVLVIGTSMFPVYIIHGQPLFWGWIQRTGGSLADRYYVMPAILVVALATFLGSIMCDLPRRCLLLISRNLIWRLGRTTIA